jgi:hypothetical protein
MHKSISIVRTTEGFAVRIRSSDHRDLFFGPVTSSGHRYTEAEAKMLELRLREQMRKIGGAGVQGGKPLPDGVSIIN